MQPQHAQLPLWRRRMGYIVSYAAVALAMLIVCRSLYRIQIVEGEYYRGLASEQQLMDSTLRATRGEIYDATGKTLASTSVMWIVGCDPHYSTVLYSYVETAELDAETGLPTGEKTKVEVLDVPRCEQVASDVTAILLSENGLPERVAEVDRSSALFAEIYTQVYEALTSINRSYMRLTRDSLKSYSLVNNAIKVALQDYVASIAAEMQEAAKIDKEHASALKNERLALVYNRTFQRSYPYGEFAAAVLGHCNDDGEGAYGLEKSYEAVLAGVNGRTITVRNAYNTAIADEGATTYEAQDGNNLILSLDINVQEVVERYLNEAVLANNVKNRGCAIVMDVNSGAILAMSSKPDYDPNEPNTIANPIYMSEMVRAEPEIYAKYRVDEEGKEILDAHGNRIIDPDADYSGTYREAQWKNKTLTEVYYPGSVFKVITSAMGVDAGVIGYNTTFNCSGAYAVRDRVYHCAGKHSHGVQNLGDALKNSCNIYYIQTGQRIGAVTFYDYFKAFGFTEPTGVDLPYEVLRTQYYSSTYMGDVELASSSFGQAMAVTPMQVCTAISACVNGGYLVTPHVVERITDKNGNVVEEIGTEQRRQVISANTSAAIRRAMEYEVGNENTTGGGHNAYVCGYRIGGKSGTSEQLNMQLRADKDYKKVASFVAVLPADDPKYLVYVMLDDPNNAKTDYSSVLAAPVVGNIISEIAPYLGVETDGIDRSGRMVKVPKLSEKEWSNAQVSLNICGLRHSLAANSGSRPGALVTYQYPKAGMTVPYGTKIYLYTSGSPALYTEVPDVQGKSAEFARQMLESLDLNCVITGDASGVVLEQDSAPGASVQLGSIVTLKCGVPAPEAGA